MQEVISRFQKDILGPYDMPGNRVSQNMYDDLLLPWNASPPVAAFPESLCVKHDYDRGGVLTNGKSFFGGGKEVTLQQIEMGYSTASMVTRWRDAHPELVGTENDVLKQYVRELREALGGKESFVRGTGTAILLFKKAA